MLVVANKKCEGHLFSRLFDINFSQKEDLQDCLKVALYESIFAFNEKYYNYIAPPRFRR